MKGIPDFIWINSLGHNGEGDLHDVWWYVNRFGQIVKSVERGTDGCWMVRGEAENLDRYFMDLDAAISSAEREVIACSRRVRKTNQKTGKDHPVG